MKRNWDDPVKNHPAKESTMNVHGDLAKFTELMKKVVNVKISKPGQQKAT